MRLRVSVRFWQSAYTHLWTCIFTRASPEGIPFGVFFCGVLALATHTPSPGLPSADHLRKHCGSSKRGDHTKTELKCRASAANVVPISPYRRFVYFTVAPGYVCLKCMGLLSLLS